MLKQKNYRLSDFEINYIKNYSETYNCTETKALKKIIEEHSKTHENEVTSFLIEKIATGVKESLNDVLTKIEKGTKSADINSQVIIELANNIYANNPDYFFIERKQEATKKAEDIVKKRIIESRGRKLDK